MVENEVEAVLIGTNFLNHGKLTVNLIPVTPEGEEIPEDMDIEEPEELLNQRLDFVVNIEGASDLPSNFCKDVYVEY